MKRYLLRAAAFAVGSMIAGCVYAENSTSSKAAMAPMPVPTFPASRPTHGDPDGDNADVTVNVPMLQLHMRAARFQVAADSGRVIGFYRQRLAKLGTVTEKSGGPHTHIQSFAWTSAPDQTTMAAGHTIVAVAPKGRATEYAIIDIEPIPVGGHT